jgi:hypothetical protein
MRAGPSVDEYFDDWFDAYSDEPSLRNQDIEYDTYWNPWRQTSPADFAIEKLWRGLFEIAHSAHTQVRPRSEAPHGDKLVDALVEHMQRITSVDWQAAIAQKLDAPREELRAAAIREPRLMPWIARHRGPMLMLLLLSPFWVRSLDAWGAPAADDDDALGRSLLEHLFGRYPIPASLFAPWTELASPGLKWATWLVILGGGASLRRAAPRLGWQVSAKLAHHLFDAPAGLEPIEAIMWAELVQRGGNEVDLGRLRRHQAFVFDTTSTTPVENAADRAGRYRVFWIATVDWIVRHRDTLTDDTCQTILDWAMHRFTEDLARGTHQHECFSWSHRSPAAAHEAAMQYANRISAKHGYVDHLVWAPRGWDWEEAEWSIRELCSARELAAESAAMTHCVVGYAQRCAAGSSSIFSARLRKERVFTIEVEPSTRSVVQVRGARNRECTDEEMALVERWLRAT